MTIILPIISGLLYRAGGTDQWKWCILNQKIWRWFIGIPIAAWYTYIQHSWIPLLCIPAYLIAVTAFVYGEKSWLNFLGVWGKWYVCGFAFGAASIPALGVVGLLQAMFGGIGFVILHYLDDKEILKNPWQEICRGVVGTLLT
jgi:hypothetical protein